jgi:hypothetical protein
MNKPPGLFGIQMLPRDLAKLLHDAGWTEIINNVRMAATVDAESDRYTAAVGTVNPDGSQDWGMFQLNNYHWHDFAPSEAAFYDLAIDPPRAVVVARSLFDKAKKNGGTGFEPWFAYGTPRWEAKLPTACRALANYTGLELAGILVL